MEIILIYPNPAENEITFSVTSSISTVVNISIVNVLGQEVIQKQTNIEKGTTSLFIDTHGLSSDCYLLKVITASGQYKDQKQFMVK